MTGFLFRVVTAAVIFFLFGEKNLRSNRLEKNRFADRPTAEDTSIRIRKIPEDWIYDGAGLAIV